MDWAKKTIEEIVIRYNSQGGTNYWRIEPWMHSQVEHLEQMLKEDLSNLHHRGFQLLSELHAAYWAKKKLDTATL